MKKGSRLFWGWFVVWGAFGMLSLTYGARYSFGVFVRPMFLEYGWPMWVISSAASVNLFVYAVTGIITGQLLDRIAPRWIMTSGAVIMTLGFVMAAFTTTPLGFCLSYGVSFGVGAGCAGVVVNGATVGKWFIRKRGLAMGVSSMGIGFGTMALPPLAGYIVKEHSWRTGFLFVGVVIFVFGVLISQVLMGKSSPEAIGLRPDGERAESHSACSEAPAHKVRRESVAPLLQNAQFWILAICYITAAMVSMMTIVHQVAYALSQDIEKVAAASSLGILGISGACGKFFFGWLSDKIKDAKYSASLGYLVMALGMYELLKADTVTGLYVFAGIFGFGYGSMAPLTPFLLADRFGREILGAALGLLVFFVAGIGGSIGPFLGGIIFDVTGSYAYAWQFNMAVMVAVSLVILTLKPREKPGRANPDAFK